MIIMDIFALPAGGTAPRVQASAPSYEYMAAYIENAKQVRHTLPDHCRDHLQDKKDNVQPSGKTGPNCDIWCFIYLYIYKFIDFFFLWLLLPWFSFQRILDFSQTLMSNNFWLKCVYTLHTCVHFYDILLNSATEWPPCRLAGWRTPSAGITVTPVMDAGCRVSTSALRWSPNSFRTFL